MKKQTGVRVAIGRLLTFQIKLLADAGRDFLLSPISAVVILIDLLLGLENDKSLYIKMMAFGVRSDHFINLFGQFSGDETIDTFLNEAARKAEQLDKN